LTAPETSRKKDEISVKEKALERWSELLGADHPKALSARRSLAIAFEHDGEYQKGIEIYRELYVATLESSGPEDQVTHSALRDLLWAKSIRESTFNANAETKDQYLALCKAADQQPGGTLFNALALSEFRFGKFERAIEAAKASVKQFPKEQGLPGPHPSDLAVLAMSYQELGDADMSNSYLEQFNQTMQHALYRADFESTAIADEVKSKLGSRLKAATKSEGSDG